MADGSRPFVLAVVLLASLLPVRAAPSGADAAASAFFDAVREKKYRAAYDFFSVSIRKDVSFADFQRGADRIQSFEILKQEVFDREPNLVKFKVRARLKVRQGGHVFLAVYAGKADVVLERGRWRVLEVELKAVDQKALQTDGSMDYHSK